MLSTQGPAKLKTAQLEEECVRLRLAGLTHRQIAAELGVAPSSAYKRVRHALDEVNKHVSEDAEELRTLELLRLDELQSAIWERALEGDDKALRGVLSIMSRRAKLAGLDAPVKTEGITIDAIEASDDFELTSERVEELDTPTFMRLG